MHSTEHHYFDAEDGFPGPGTLHHHVIATVSGSWWSGPFDERGVPVAEQRDGTPNGYHILEVDGTDLAVRYKAAGAPADYQMRILFDVAHHGLNENGMRDFAAGELFEGHLSLDELAAAEVIVNLFDGGPQSRVEFAVGGQPFRPMSRVARADPSVNELFVRFPEAKKSWVKASPSSHIFTADLPDDLQPGVHTVTVRATDEFGRVFHGHRILEIVAGFPPARAGLTYR
jgi:hypothetical protein